MQLDMFGTQKLSARPPFTYLGGKRLARRDILRCFPDGLDVLVSPFLGGGSVELLAASRGIRVHGFDKFAPLVRLWNTLLNKVADVAVLTHREYPYNADMLKGFVQDGSHAMHIEDDVEFASVAWSMAQQAYGGTFMNGTTFDITGRSCVGAEFFNPEKWVDWGNDNLSVKCQTWEDTLSEFPEAFMYVDPPYVGNERRYGSKHDKSGFDHHALAEALKSHNGGWVLSYAKNPLITELYEEFETLHPRWAQFAIATHKGRDARSGKEVYILKPPAVNPLNRLSIENAVV